MRVAHSLSPRDLALAVGSSESSLKRWVDDGQISALRTDGGHRRIARSEAIRFIRESRTQIVDPALLGLQRVTPVILTEIRKGRGEAALADALSASQFDRVEGILQGLYLSGQSAASVFDGAVSHALNRFIERRRIAGEGVDTAQERSCAMITECLGGLTSLLPPVDPNSGMASVHSGEGAWGDLRAAMARIVLEECGYNVTNGAASEQSGRTRLVWLPAESVASRNGSPQASLESAVQALAASLGSTGGHVAVCGQRVAVDGSLANERVHVTFCMSELAALARSLGSTSAPPASMTAHRRPR